MARYERPTEDLARRPSAREARRRPVAGSLSAPLTAAPPSPDAMSADTIASLQRSAGNAGVAAYLEESETASPETASPDAVLAEPGRSLDAGIRGEMETSLGADFSTVRVHEGGTAAASAHALGARAYTVGEDIVVGSGGSDRKTMAHELTHVVQQRAGSVDGTPTGAGYSVSDPGDPFERAASQTAAAIVGGQSVATGSAGSAPSGSSAQRAGDEQEEQPVQTAPEDEEIPTVSIDDLPSAIPTVSVEDLPKAPGATQQGDSIPTVSVEDLPKAPGATQQGDSIPTVSSPEELPQLIQLPDMVVTGQAPTAATGQAPTAATGSGSAPSAPANSTGAPATTPGAPVPSANQQSDATAATASPPSTASAADPRATVTAGGTQSAVVGALWTSMVVGPIRSAVTTTAGDKPDYKSAAATLRGAREAALTVMVSLPDRDPRINGIATLLTELDLYIEVTANRAHEAGDQPANVATIISAVADDAVAFGSALREEGAGGQAAILSALWTAGAVSPIRAAATAVAGDKPDYASAASGLRRARETLLTVLTSLPMGDPRIARVSTLLDELDLYIEVTSDRAHVASDQPADVSRIVGALADDATKFGYTLVAS